MTNNQFFKELSNKDILHELREESIEDMESAMLPFGYIIDGTEDSYDPYADFY